MEILGETLPEYLIRIDCTISTIALLFALSPNLFTCLISHHTIWSWLDNKEAINISTLVHCEFDYLTLGYIIIL